jgi:hypothetical protein
MGVLIEAADGSAVLKHFVIEQVTIDRRRKASGAQRQHLFYVKLATTRGKLRFDREA